MKISHSSCVRFLQKYRNHFFSDNTSSVIGALIIPDAFNQVDQANLILRAISKCDKLYILKFNDNISDIESGRSLFERTEIEIDNKPVRVFQLGFFFDSTRYLPENTGGNDCKEEYLFTEKSLAMVIFREMSVCVRYIPADYHDLIYRTEIEQIYNDVHIRIVNI